MKSFETHNGKEIKLIIENKTAHIKIVFGSGGELPQDFEGLFTNERAAEIAINAYLERMKPRKKDKEE